MNFVQIQDEVLADRFSPTKRGQVKNWINYRYGRVWVSEPWSFKYQVTDLALLSGETQVDKGSIGKIISFGDHTNSTFYSDVIPVRPEDFWRYATSTMGSIPRMYTVLGDKIVFERPAPYDMTYKVVSEKPFVPLVNDIEVPLIPEDFHLLLAQGASAHGLRLENDPSWQGYEDDYQKAIEDMKHEYLTAVSTYGDVAPAWP